MKENTKINDIVDKLCLTGSLSILTEASEKATDSTSLKNKEVMKKIEREARMDRMIINKKYKK